MRDKWETNMVLHTAFGMLISFSSMFWGFWVIDLKKGWDSNTYAEKTRGKNINPTTGQRMYLHTFAGMTVPLMAVPLIVTGFIAYFRRW